MDVRYVIYNLAKNTSGFSQDVQLRDSRGGVLFSSPLAIAIGNDPSHAGQATRLILPSARGHYTLLVTIKDQKMKVEIVTTSGSHS